MPTTALPAWLTTPAPVSPWLGIAVVSTLIAGVFGGVWWWRRLARPAPELTRKAVHIGMGAVAAAVPWVFDRTWPVLLLCGGVAAGFIALKAFARRTELGEAIYGIGRHSRGELYFACSVAALWLLADGDRLLFLVPVLVLTLGDALAGLVGRQWGRRFFAPAQTGKTIEGSLALFVVAFVSVQVPFAFAARVGPVEALLLAVTVALLVTMLEAVAWHGLDNLLVPLGAYLELRAAVTLDAAALAWRLLVAVTIVAIVAAGVWQRAAAARCAEPPVPD